MLVLTRKVGEVVNITIPGSLTADGEPVEIKVQVNRIGPSRVRLCFDAIRKILITRHELLHPEELAA